MKAAIEAPSAKIYQFPPGGRRSLQGSALKAASDVLVEQSAKVVCGGGWYHDEAIKDDALQSGK